MAKAPPRQVSSDEGPLIGPPPVIEEGREPSKLGALLPPRWLFRAAGLMLLAVLTPWALHQLPVLRDRMEYQASFERIELDPAPTADMPADFLRQVQQRALLPSELSVLDPKLPNLVAEAFAAHPWVERVLEVRNRHPARITVKLEYRRPVALIEVPDGVYAVDSKGVLLPPADFSVAKAKTYITVKGIGSAPQASAGKRWGDPAVESAAQLADFLGERWRKMDLSAIVAPAIGPDPQDPDTLSFDLVTKGGSRIHWGRAPGSTYPGELTAGQKLGRLEKYLAEFGSFERPLGPYEIDIRHWQEITRRPLANSHLNTARQPGRPAIRRQ